MADDISRKVLMASVKGCSTSSDYSDLVITCSSDTHKAHRMIVCSRTGFSAKAIKFGGAINLPEDEPAIVKLLLQYLYEGEYDPSLPDIPKSSKKVVEDGSLIDTSLAGMGYPYEFPHHCHGYNNGCGRAICPHHKCGQECAFPSCRHFICEACKLPNDTVTQLLIHAKMYEYADKYEVIGLKELSLAKFDAACQVFWDEDVFGSAAHHAFSTTMDEDRGLRDIVSATIAKHMELIRKPVIKVVLTQFNGLSLGIMEQRTKDHGWGVKTK